MPVLRKQRGGERKTKESNQGEVQSVLLTEEEIEPVKKKRTIGLPVDTTKEKSMATRAKNKADKFDESNAKSIYNALMLASKPKVDITNAEEVERRIMEYFTYCAENGMKCSVPGLSAALGLDRRRLSEISLGQAPMGYSGKKPTREVVEIVNRAMTAYESYIEDMMLSGNAQPIVGIFTLKCHRNYNENDQITIKTNDMLGDVEDASKIAERYKNMVD